MHIINHQSPKYTSNIRWFLISFDDMKKITTSFVVTLKKMTGKSSFVGYLFGIKLALLVTKLYHKWNEKNVYWYEVPLILEESLDYLHTKKFISFSHIFIETLVAIKRSELNVSNWEN